MAITAIYSSVLYGADFIAESLASILPYVDRVYIVMMQRPWGDTQGVLYKGEWISWPDKFDDTRERVKSINNVKIIETQKFSPWNRWGFALDRVLEHQSLDEVMFIDPDCVFSDSEALKVFSDWNGHKDYERASSDQVELWRTPAWQITRPRSMISFHRGDLSLIRSPDPPDGRQRYVPTTQHLSGKIHNFGFCVSAQAMRWKHLTSMAFSPVIHESLPNPDWYEKKWLTWHPSKNNRDLEVSLGHESSVREAVPYDVNELPKSIKARYDAGEWREIW